ncbi:hypothetical protein Zmor_008424 [Zophobas morio]|uniref:Uncharacterized protein n=1 Tax=Zophobas morio TaxID=2755281 RepID=A0AA38IY44_9CUCU|nr:hypothetical protein Zmor_008424 [Zophobas morio]
MLSLRFLAFPRIMKINRFSRPCYISSAELGPVWLLNCFNSRKNLIKFYTFTCISGAASVADRSSFPDLGRFPLERFSPNNSVSTINSCLRRKALDFGNEPTMRQGDRS